MEIENRLRNKLNQNFALVHNKNQNLNLKSERELPLTSDEYSKRYKFIFSWRKNQSTNNKSECEVWEQFDENNQKHLKKAYLDYLLNQKNCKIRLLPPLNKYMFHFDWNQVYNELENSLFMIKIERFDFDSSNELHNSEKLASNFKSPKSNSDKLSLKKQLSDEYDILNFIDSESNYLNFNEYDEFKFFWNSKSDDNQSDFWQSYSDNNQLYLNDKYREFCLDKNKDNIMLLNKYLINFMNLFQYDISNNNIYKIKIKKIRLHFFWKSNKDPWDKNQESSWAPYDLENQYILKNAYHDFLKDNSKN